VAYGLSATNLNMTTVEDPALTITHSVRLSNLTAGTRYYYRPYSRDASRVEYGASSVSSFKTRQR
jgi:phosphodiesterase/alkaline phosphatase D-like protein